MNSNSSLKIKDHPLQKLSKFQLPHSFKIIGLIIIVVSYIAKVGVPIFLYKNEYKTLFLTMIEYSFLIGFLFVSISKETIEDEFIRRIRMQSYMFSFITGVILAILLPFIRSSLKFFVDPKFILEPLSDFTIISILLVLQIIAFYILRDLIND